MPIYFFILCPFHKPIFIYPIDNHYIVYVSILPYFNPYALIWFMKINLSESRFSQPQCHSEENASTLFFKYISNSGTQCWNNICRRTITVEEVKATLCCIKNCITYQHYQNRVCFGTGKLKYKFEHKVEWSILWYILRVISWQCLHRIINIIRRIIYWSSTAWIIWDKSNIVWYNKAVVDCCRTRE